MQKLREAAGMDEDSAPGGKNLQMYNDALARVKSHAAPPSLDTGALQSKLRNIALSHLKETQIGDKKNLIEGAIQQAVAAGVPEAEINTARSALNGGPRA